MHCKQLHFCLSYSSFHSNCYLSTFHSSQCYQRSSSHCQPLCARGTVQRNPHNLIFSKLLKEKLTFWNPEPYFVTASFGCLESIRNCKTTGKNPLFYLFLRARKDYIFVSFCLLLVWNIWIDYMWLVFVGLRKCLEEGENQVRVCFWLNFFLCFISDFGFGGLLYVLRMWKKWRIKVKC